MSLICVCSCMILYFMRTDKKLMDDFIQSKERNVELRNEITFLRHAQGAKDVSDRNIE